MAKTYFISDTHLNPQNPLTQKRLVAFMQRVKKETQALYILGDLTDRWVGDDQDTKWLTPFLNSCEDWHQARIPIYFMQGNHDALIGPHFFEQTHMIKIPDPYCITLANERLLLAHGDRWVPSHWYGMYRSLMHHPIIKRLVLTLPLSIRRRCLHSPHDTRPFDPTRKPNIDLHTLKDEAKTQGATWVIHGHFHTPILEKIDHLEHMILGDWLHPSIKVGCLNHQLQKLTLLMLEDLG